MWIDQLDRIIKSLQFPPTISVIVGAGASVASGLRTFRGEDGHYRGRRPEELASIAGFLSDPTLVWGWYQKRIEAVFQAEPNPIHHSLVRLENHNLLDKIITQNVDGLHRRAGQSSTHLIEIHGNILETHCLEQCGVQTILHSPPEVIPVKCSCGSYQRPSVVWFGEQLNSTHLYDAQAALERADLLLVIGTSGYVVPVATMPYIAQRNGSKIIDFNVNPTQISQMSELFIQGEAEKTVPQLVDHLINF